jgi:hypothetical protein
MLIDSLKSGRGMLLARYGSSSSCPLTEKYVGFMDLRQTSLQGPLIAEYIGLDTLAFRGCGPESILSLQYKINRILTRLGCNVLNILITLNEVNPRLISHETVPSTDQAPFQSYNQ